MHAHTSWPFVITIGVTMEATVAIYACGIWWIRSVQESRNETQSKDNLSNFHELCSDNLFSVNLLMHFVIRIEMSHSICMKCVKNTCLFLWTKTWTTAIIPNAKMQTRQKKRQMTMLKF